MLQWPDGPCCSVGQEDYVPFSSLPRARTLTNFAFYRGQGYSDKPQCPWEWILPRQLISRGYVRMYCTADLFPRSSMEFSTSKLRCTWSTRNSIYAVNAQVLKLHGFSPSSDHFSSPSEPEISLAVMGASPYPSRGPGVTAFCILMIISSILAVILRIWSRYTSRKQKFWWDDWFAIASLVSTMIWHPIPDALIFINISLIHLKPCILASSSIHLLMVSAGLGHHANQISPENFTLFLKYSYAAQFGYRTGITLPKYSALLFYMRVFRIRWDSIIFRTNIFVAASFCTAWLLVSIFLDVFTCVPLQKYWLPLVPGHCVNLFPRGLGTAITSVLIDVYIMILPIPILWSLHAGRVRKLVLTGFFFCAYW